MTVTWRRRRPAKRKAAGPEPPAIAGTITAIEAQARARSERVNVRIDGEFAFSLAAQEALALRVGDELDASQIGEFLDRDTAERAYHRALNFLAARPRSALEIRRRLRAAGVDDGPVSETIARLERQGLVDDAQFAAFWVEQRQTFKPRGPRALRSELRARGVAGDTITRAIAATSENQVDAACRAGLREAGRRCAHGEREFAQALGKYLARRGFDYGVVRDATTQLWLRVKSEASDQT
jgi:regulatory protein